MRYYWLRDRQTQQQFLFFWDKGSNNDADYFTKHFPASYHRVKRSRYVQDKINIVKELHRTYPLISVGVQIAGYAKKSGNTKQVKEHKSEQKPRNIIRKGELFCKNLRAHVEITEDNFFPSTKKQKMSQKTVHCEGVL